MARSTILNFYLGECRHLGTGLFLDELIALSDEELDGVQGYMHWVFPLRKPSNRYGGPTLTDDEHTLFRTDRMLRTKYLFSVMRFLKFFGFIWTLDGNDTQVEIAPEAESRQRQWLEVNSVHQNSITRILQSLMLLGFDGAGRKFYDSLKGLYLENPGRITEKRFIYWTQAVENRDYWNSST